MPRGGTARRGANTRSGTAAAINDEDENFPVVNHANRGGRGGRHGHAIAPPPAPPPYTYTPSGLPTNRFWVLGDSSARNSMTGSIPKISPDIANSGPGSLAVVEHQHVNDADQANALGITVGTLEPQATAVIPERLESPNKAAIISPRLVPLTPLNRSVKMGMVKPLTLIRGIGLMGLPDNSRSCSAPAGIHMPRPGVPTMVREVSYDRELEEVLGSEHAAHMVDIRQFTVQQQAMGKGKAPKVMTDDGSVNGDNDRLRFLNSLFQTLRQEMIDSEDRSDPNFHVQIRDRFNEAIRQNDIHPDQSVDHRLEDDLPRFHFPQAYFDNRLTEGDAHMAHWLNDHPDCTIVDYHHAMQHGTPAPDTPKTGSIQFKCETPEDSQILYHRIGATDDERMEFQRRRDLDLSRNIQVMKSPRNHAANPPSNPPSDHPSSGNGSDGNLPRGNTPRLPNGRDNGINHGNSGFPSGNGYGGNGPPGGSPSGNGRDNNQTPKPQSWHNQPRPNIYGHHGNGAPPPPPPPPGGGNGYDGDQTPTDNGRNFNIGRWNSPFYGDVSQNDAVGLIGDSQDRGDIWNEQLQSVAERIRKMINLHVSVSLGVREDGNRVNVVRVSAPPSYNGHKDLQRFYVWFGSCLRWMKINHLGGSDREEERVAHIGTALEDKAVKWYEDNVDGFADRVWSLFDVIMGLYIAFIHETVIHEATENFNAIKFTGTVDEFYRELEAAAKRLVQQPDVYTFKTRFLAGLPLWIRNGVFARDRSAQHSSVKQLYEAACKSEHHVTMVDSFRNGEPSISSEPRRTNVRGQTRIDLPRWPDGRFLPRNARDRDGPAINAKSDQPRAMVGTGTRNPDPVRTGTQTTKVGYVNPRYANLRCNACKNLGHIASDSNCPQYGKGRPRIMNIKPQNEQDFEVFEEDYDSEQEIHREAEELFMRAASPEDAVGIDEPATLEDFGVEVDETEDTQERMQRLGVFEDDDADYHAGDVQFKAMYCNEDAWSEEHCAILRLVRKGGENHPLVALVTINGHQALTLFDSGCTTDGVRKVVKVSSTMVPCDEEIRYHLGSPKQFNCDQRETVEVLTKLQNDRAERDSRRRTTVEDVDDDETALPAKAAGKVSALGPDNPCSLNKEEAEDYLRIREEKRKLAEELLKLRIASGDTHVLESP
ncbi:hypothetical protein C8J56DRAFT_905616 [Mycena floridula]|nr:hypothetical protein C8J56DRAFT_905616 [Mycena floridula]